MSKENTKVAIVALFGASVQHSRFTRGARPTKTTRHFSTQSAPVADCGRSDPGSSGRKGRHRSPLFADARSWELWLLPCGSDSTAKGAQRQLGCPPQESQVTLPECRQGIKCSTGAFTRCPIGTSIVESWPQQRDAGCWGAYASQLPGAVFGRKLRS
jgi:hypothetical protein